MDFSDRCVILTMSIAYQFLKQNSHWRKRFYLFPSLSSLLCVSLAVFWRRRATKYTEIIKKKYSDTATISFPKILTLNRFFVLARGEE